MSPRTVPAAAALTGPRLGALLVPEAPPGRALDLTALGRLAARAEDLGLARVAVSDHLAFHLPTYDPVVCLAAMAAATSRVRIASQVLLLPLRHPVQVAQSFTSLDLLSGGRVELGVGLGGEWPDDYAAVGIDPRTRGRRADESLEVIRALWAHGEVSFAGRAFQLGRFRLAPLPAQRPHPPIVVGGRSEPAVRRAARFADRWDGIFLTPERYVTQAALLADLAGAAGRRVGTGLVAWACFAPPGRARTELAAALHAYYRQPFERFARYVLCGGVDQAGERLAEFVAAGASDVTLILCGRLEEQLEATAALGRVPARAGATEGAGGRRG